MPGDAYHIRRCSPAELRALPEIERAAGRLFLLTKHPLVAAHGTLALEFLREQQRAGLVWVAAGEGGQPIGFAVARELAGSAHLQELSVHPDHGRRGIGTRLAREVCEWARGAGHDLVTLSTFRDVPWNAPFYARLGFEVIGEEELGEELAGIRAGEAAAGLPVEDRVFMRLGL